jgi:toxin ParE1/3/4
LKLAHLQPQAEADLLEATRHYATEGSVALAEHMFDAAIAALESIKRIRAPSRRPMGNHRHPVCR